MVHHGVSQPRLPRHGGPNFRKNFALPIERSNDPAARPSCAPGRARSSCGALKTDPTIISDLPEKQEMKVYCSLTREQAHALRSRGARLLEQIDAAEGHPAQGPVLAS